MSDRKPSARRPSRDDDDAPAPKKKDSGSQKPLKKKTSARKVAEEEEVADDEEDEKPKTKRSSARGSARSAAGGSARSAGGSARQAGGGPDKGKVFLYFVPGVILVLLGLGYYVATLPEPKGPEVIKVDYNTDVNKARAMYNQAKAAFEVGNKIEGPGGLPKLEECKHLCEDGMALIDKVREAVGEAEQKAGKPVENYAFEDLATQLGQLFKIVKSQIQERK